MYTLNRASRPLWVALMGGWGGARTEGAGQALPVIDCGIPPAVGGFTVGTEEGVINVNYIDRQCNCR